MACTKVCVGFFCRNHFQYCVGEKAGMVSLHKIHFQDMIYFNYGYNRYVTPNECEVAIEDDVEAEVHKQKSVMQNGDKVDFIDLTLHPPSLTQESINIPTEEKATTTSTLNNSSDCLIEFLFITILYLIICISGSN